MKTIRTFWVPSLVAVMLTVQLGAAPLTWFPGPAIDSPVSGAMTVVYRVGKRP